MSSLPSTHSSLLAALGCTEEAEPAWQSFVQRYREPIVAQCLRRGVQRSSAEDVTQNVLFKVWRSWKTFDPARGGFRLWLAAVIRNALRDHFANLQKHPDAQHAGAHQALLDQLQDPQLAEDLATTVETSVNRDLQAALARVRGRVEERTWQAFYRMVAEGQRAHEVGRDTGMSPGAVHQARYRIVQLVAAELALIQREPQDS